MNPNITLREALEQNKNFMIVKKGCPFCHRAHDLVKDKLKGIEFKEFDHKKYETLTSQAQEKYNHFTYPLIIKDGEFIGGCSDLEKILK